MQTIWFRLGRLRKGKVEGKPEVLVRQLESKFGSIPVDLHQRIGGADSEQLLAWAERILTAQKVADVFDG